MFSVKTTSPLNGFVFHYLDNSDTTYDYVCYFSMTGDCIIARIKKDNTEQLFAYIPYEDNPSQVWENGDYTSLEYKKIYEIS